MGLNACLQPTRVQPIAEGSEEIVDPEIGDGLPVVLTDTLNIRTVESRSRFIRSIGITAAWRLDEGQPRCQIIAATPLLALGLKIQRLLEWISWASSARQLAWMLLAITPVGSGIPGVGS